MERPSKKTWTPPSLTALGSIENLTRQAKVAGTSDGVTTGSLCAPPCTIIGPS